MDLKNTSGLRIIFSQEVMGSGARPASPTQISRVYENNFLLNVS